jgi:hypothetical protein
MRPCTNSITKNAVPTRGGARVERGAGASAAKRMQARTQDRRVRAEAVDARHGHTRALQRVHDLKLALHEMR